MREIIGTRGEHKIKRHKLQSNSIHCSRHLFDALVFLILVASLEYQDPQSQAVRLRKIPFIFTPATSLPDAYNAVRFLKTFQVSACDREQLEIKCNEDYRIDVIHAARTILLSKNTTRLTQQIGPKPSHKICQTDSHLSTISVLNDTAKSNSCNAQEVSVDGRFQADGDEITKRIKTICRFSNFCSIDLRWNPPNGTSEELIHLNDTATTRPVPPSVSIQSTARAELARMLNEPCQESRKLLEVSYRCRPAILTRRVGCRGITMTPKCDDEKRLVIISSEYGSWGSETKNQDSCRTDKQSNQAARGNPNGHDESLLGDCWTNASTSLLMNDCLLQRQCQIEVSPSVLGNPNCPQNRVEYLKLVYYCANETILQEHAFNRTYIRSLFSKQLSQQPFTSTNVSSSSLLSTTSTSLNHSTPATQSIEPMNSSEAQESSGFIMRSQNLSDEHETDFRQPRSQDGSALNSRVYTIISADPELSGRHPSTWLTKHMLRFFVARYQPQIVVLICFMLISIILALLIRSIRLRNISKNSSRESSSSTCKKAPSKTRHHTSSSSSNSHHGPKHSVGSSSASSSTGSSGAAALAASKLNSYSESCFSLDDYHQTGHQQLVRNPSQATRSPALGPDGAPFNNLDAPDGLCYSWQQTAQIRPRLWGMYQPGLQQQAQPFTCATIMRQESQHPTSTFQYPPRNHLTLNSFNQRKNSVGLSSCSCNEPGPPNISARM